MQLKGSKTHGNLKAGSRGNHRQTAAIFTLRRKPTSRGKRRRSGLPVHCRGRNRSRPRHLEYLEQCAIRRRTFRSAATRLN